MARNIINGAKINPGKLTQTRELRQEMTVGERILWENLRANRLQGLKFRRQQIIDGLIVDFYCHAAGLVVEIDGAIHRLQPERDQERDKILSARGLRILHILDEDVRLDIDSVIKRILNECEKKR